MVAFRNAASGQDFGSVTVASPSAFDGDVLVALVGANNDTSGATLTYPGWTLVQEFEQFDSLLWVLYRVIEDGSSEPLNYTFTDSGGIDWMAAVVCAYSGVDTTAPVDDSAILGGGSTTLTAPSVTTTREQGKIVAAFTCPVTVTWTPPAATATRGLVSDEPSLLVADYDQVAVGATGARSAGISGSPVDWVTAQIALRSGNRSPSAPLVSDQGPFNRAVPNRISLGTFSDPDPGDSPSAWKLYYRVAGTADPWTLVSIPNPNNFWDAPAGTFTADLYEAQTEVADQAGVWSPRSASFFITAGDAPPGPTILDPINGQTIATPGYTGTISAPDVDESEWTLYADNAGSIDETTILQGPVTKTTGDLRSHTFEGLANGVTVWWSVRVKHDGLWSQPAQIRTPVSYTPPPSPVVTYTQVPAEGAVDIAVTNPAPGAGEPAVSNNDVFIRDPGEGWERRATMLAPNSTWRYWTPVSGWDPGANIRVTAVAENSTTATTEGATET